MTANNVTFDTCSLDKIVKNRDVDSKIRRAILDDRIRGFYCETVVTLEGVMRKERKEILSRTRPISLSSSDGEGAIRLAVGIQHFRPPLHPDHAALIEAVEAIGMRAIRGPARIGGVRARADQLRFAETCTSIQELLERRDKVNALASAIAQRGVGYAVPVELGLKNLTPVEIAKPTLWSDGLRRLPGHTSVHRAIAEWADADAIAAHYGSGNELFCTEELPGKQRRSVLNAENRAWLEEHYSIKFVSLAQLAERLL
ncbi:hypothetical protein [Bradyrhizobium liaoningense]|uniref:hypothetical protein n=1 Tax=Bradyrhizobium liaoningense TaxID=43992 RepID=UPI001BA4E2C3|nr:hypothetical protein [Bradyrhizobium liaoningense]MBR1169158.1 hypothetical protein [Bradyrhizobium liaoningense]